MSNEEPLLPIALDTSLVTFTVKVNGDQLPTDIPIESIIIHNEANRITMAQLRIADGDAASTEWIVSNDTFFVPGNEIEILAGYHSEDELIFSGIVTKHSLRVRHQRTELLVECRHKAIAMTIAPNSSQFAEMSDAEIASTLLDVYELTGNIADTPVTHAEMVQYDCTDWDFLITRLDAIGFVAIANEGKIDIVKPEVTAEGLATLRFGTNLVEFDAEIDGCKQYGSVKAQAWDPSGQVLLEAESAEPEWTAPGNIDPAEVGATTGAGSYTLRQPGRLTEEEVQSWADARLLRSRMAFMCGRAKVEGFATALPGITVALEGLGDRFNGFAWVSGVRHELSGGNWYTDLQLGLTPKLHANTFPQQTPSAGALLPGISGLHTAVVAALESDPDGEARIRVKIPSVSLDGDGVWARVATLDAGNERGTFFLPEVDDEVVVGFLNDDPRLPVVLGCLFSSAKVPPLEAADANPEKGYFSREKMRILFNDEKKTITIDTPGNVLLLDEDNGKISIKDKNGNKIEMTSSGITIESAGDLKLKASGDVKIESTKNLELKGGMQFKAEGTAGLELNSSAITVVKGSMVQIN